MEGTFIFFDTSKQWWRTSAIFHSSIRQLLRLKYACFITLRYVGLTNSKNLRQSISHKEYSTRGMVRVLSLESGVISSKGELSVEEGNIVSQRADKIYTWLILMTPKLSPFTFNASCAIRFVLTSTFVLTFALIAIKSKEFWVKSSLASQTPYAKICWLVSKF